MCKKEGAPQETASSKIKKESRTEKPGQGVRNERHEQQEGCRLLSLTALHAFLLLPKNTRFLATSDRALALSSSQGVTRLQP